MVKRLLQNERHMFSLVWCQFSDPWMTDDEENVWLYTRVLCDGQSTSLLVLQVVHIFKSCCKSYVRLHIFKAAEYDELS